MRSLALIAFALATWTLGCATHTAPRAQPAPPPAPPEPAADPDPALAPPAPPEPEEPQSDRHAEEEDVPMDPLTGRPPEHIVKAHREGQLKLPKPAKLHKEKPNACRSPAEPGCAQCCITSKPNGCFGQHGSTEPPGNGSPPWFNGAGKLSDGPCPKDCKPCAQCTLREEWELLHARIPDPTQCDCTKRYPGIDHCYNPMSCGCTCGAIRGIIERCPHLHPARAEVEDPGTIAQ